MKKILLTSNLGTGIKINGTLKPCKIDNSNNIIELIKTSLNKQRKLLIIVSEPKDYTKNDFFHELNKKSFELSGFEFNEVYTIDNRNKSDIKNIIKDADLIISGGGHVKTQNDWFKELK